MSSVRKNMILGGGLFFSDPCIYIYIYIHTVLCKKKRHPKKYMIFSTDSSLLHKHEFSLICPLYGGKISRGIQIFYQNFSTRPYFAARLYVKKCKTCVCTHQPELPSGHSRAIGIGWNHRFDDV